MRTKPVVKLNASNLRVLTRFDSLKDAARHAGITPQALEYWLRTGKARNGALWAFENAAEQRAVQARLKARRKAAEALRLAAQKARNNRAAANALGLIMKSKRPAWLA